MRLFKKADLYAMPVTLRFKGEKKFYTNFGACVSIVIILVIVFSLYSSLTILYARGPEIMTVS
jgi:hypothetical protein